MAEMAIRSKNATDRIALRGVRVRSQLVALGQKTTIEQSFVNLEKHAIEAVYTFPLPDGAAVCHFEAITGDRVLTGQVEEASKAEDQYDEAISDGHGAFLLEQHRPDIFTVNVGNIKPHQAVTIRLEYVAELEVRDSSIRLAFPTTAAPRYITKTGMDPARAMIEGEQINPPHVLSVPYGLSLAIDVDLGVPVGAIESSSHPVRTERRTDGTWHVTLGGEVTEMDRDIVLTLALEEAPQPFAQVGTGPDGNTFVAVTVHPHFDDDDAPPPASAEIIFVLDCSGSMGGDSIVQARSALELCLRSLSEHDTFNIYRFGSTFRRMSPEPLAYSQESLDRALAYVEGAEADLGGTELYKPLADVFKRRIPDSRVRQVILLTDGQMGNEEAIIDLARSHRNTCRIFAFGIGWASSKHLVNGLARATRGAAKFVSAGERIEDKVLRTFSRLSAPPVTDVEVDWLGREVTAASPEAPTIFEGDSVTFYGRVVGTAPAECKVRMKTPTGPAEWSVPVPEAGEDHQVVATMWARRMIRYLEESASHAQGSRRAQRREKKQLVRLSKEFGLLCSETSFVAVEHRSLEERNDGHPALRRVPVQLARSWHGISKAARGPGFLRRHMSFARHSRCHIMYNKVAGPPADTSDVFACVSAPFKARESTPKRSEPELAPHLALMATQQADGSFTWDDCFEEPLRELGLSIEQCRRAVEGSIPGLGDAEQAVVDRAVHTLIVLFLMRVKFGVHLALYKRAQGKARRFIARQTGASIVAIDDALDELKRLAMTNLAR